MFEASATPGEDIQEDVLLVGQASPHVAVVADDFFSVGNGAWAVPNTVFALIDEEVGNAIDLKTVDGGIAGEDGGIDEGIVVGGEVVVGIAARRLGEAGGGGLPGGGEFEGDVVGELQASDESDEGGGTVEEGETALNPVGADGHFVAVDTIGEVEAFRARCFDEPAVLAGGGEGERLTGIGGDDDGIDVTGELADKVGAGGPDGHEDFRGGAGDGEVSVYGDVVVLRVREADGVANWFLELGGESGGHDEGEAEEKFHLSEPLRRT